MSFVESICAIVDEGCKRLKSGDMLSTGERFAEEGQKFFSDFPFQLFTSGEVKEETPFNHILLTQICALNTVFGKFVHIWRNWRAY